MEMVKVIKDYSRKQIQSPIKKFYFAKVRKIRTKDRIFLNVFL